MLEHFEDIADDIGIQIPDSLAKLIEIGARPAGPGGVAPLMSFYDFEFIDAGDAERMLGDWLGRNKQRGADYTLFPFGQSGAGDAYCLVELEEGDKGIALVMHDQESSTLEYPSISHWITDGYIKCCANLQDLDCEPTCGVKRMVAEIKLISTILWPEHRELLEGLLSSDIVERPFSTGPKAQPQQVPSLIAQDAADSLHHSLVCDDLIDFDVIPEWED